MKNLKKLVQGFFSASPTKQRSHVPFTSLKYCSFFQLMQIDSQNSVPALHRSRSCQGCPLQRVSVTALVLPSPTNAQGNSIHTELRLPLASTRQMRAPHPIIADFYLQVKSYSEESYRVRGFCTHAAQLQQFSSRR